MHTDLTPITQLYRVWDAAVGSGERTVIINLSERSFTLCFYTKILGRPWTWRQVYPFTEVTISSCELEYLALSLAAACKEALLNAAKELTT